MGKRKLTRRDCSSRPSPRSLRTLQSVLLSLVVLLALGGIAKAQADSVSLFAACINDLQVDINGAASPGASVTNISWSWGDGTTTTGFFPQSHTYSIQGTYIITVTANYNDGSNASATQSVGVGAGILSNCEALTIAAGQYGSVFYQASVGSGTVSVGSYITLQLDSADDVSITANPDNGFLFSTWSVAGGVTGLGGVGVDTTAESTDIVVNSNGTINANFALSVTSPPVPTATPTVESYPPVTGLFNSQATSFLPTFISESSSNAQNWLTSSSIATNVSTATNLLSISGGPGYKRTFGAIASGSSLVSTSLGLSGTLIDPGDPEGVLLTATGLLLGTPGAQTNLNPVEGVTDQLAIDGASTALSCAEAAGTAVVPNFDLGCALSIGSTAADITSDVASALEADPIDPNYQQVFIPQPIVSASVVLAGSNQSLGAVTWNVLNAVDESTMWMNALRVTANRYATALAYGDPTSAGLQYMTFLNYFGLYASAAGSASLATTALANDMTAQGVGTQPVTQQAIQQGLNFLESQGASSAFITGFFGSLGFSSAQIQSMIQQVEANPPYAPPRTPVIALQNLANDFAFPGVHLVATLQSFTADWNGGQFLATVSITNTGASTANNLSVIAADLGRTPTSTSLPVVLGNLGYAGSDTLTLTFPIEWNGGRYQLLSIGETYAGGSAEQIVPLRLPQPCNQAPTMWWFPI